MSYLTSGGKMVVTNGAKFVTGIVAVPEPLSPFTGLIVISTEMMPGGTINMQASDFVESQPTNGTEPYTYQISRDSGDSWGASATFICADIDFDQPYPYTTQIDVSLRVFDSSDPVRFAYANSALLLSDSMGNCP